MALAPSRNTKLFIGASLIIPLVWGFGLMAITMLAVTSGALDGGFPPGLLPVMLVGHLIAILAGLGAWVWSLVHAAGTPHLTPTQRTTWIVLLAVFTTFAAIPYFFRHVWPEH